MGKAEKWKRMDLDGLCGEGVKQKDTALGVCVKSILFGTICTGQERFFEVSSQIGKGPIGTKK